MLKPADIEEKTFSTALRGYDLNEVDDFLDEVVATIRDLEEQVATSRSGKPAAVAPDPVHDESAVGRALIAAQAAADRLLEEARAEADRIRAEARTDADSWIHERQAMKTEAEREMAQLTDRVSHVRRELAVLATAVADGLDQMDEAIEAAARPTSTATDAAVEPVGETTEIAEEVEAEVVDDGVESRLDDVDGSGESWGLTDLEGAVEDESEVSEETADGDEGDGRKHVRAGFGSDDDEVSDHELSDDEPSDDELPEDDEDD